MAVLDLACGCGYGSRVLYDAGAKVTALDIEPQAIKHAEENYPGPFYVAVRAESLRGEFDMLVSFETLEHLKDPASVLKQVRAPIIVASVPNEECYPFDAAKFAGDDYPHQRHYTPDQFAQLLEGAGYEVKERWCQRDKHDAAVVSGTAGAFLIYVGERGSG